MEKALVIFDPNSNILTDMDGEILRENVKISSIKQAAIFKEMTEKQVSKLSIDEVKGLIRAKYHFQGVRTQLQKPAFKYLNDLIEAFKKNGVTNTFIMRALMIFTSVSYRQGLLYNPKRHCESWTDMMNLKYLNLNSKSELYRFKAFLMEYDLIKLVISHKKMLVLNPIYGYNNTTVFATTYAAYGQHFNLGNLEKRYFELGFDSEIRVKNEQKGNNKQK